MFKGVDCVCADFVCQAFFSWGSTSLAVTFASYKLLPWDSLLRVRCLAASGLQTQEPEVPKLYFAYLGSVKPPSSSAAAFCRPIRRRTGGWLSFYSNRRAQIAIRVGLQNRLLRRYACNMRLGSDALKRWHSFVSCFLHQPRYTLLSLTWWDIQCSAGFMSILNA